MKKILFLILAATIASIPAMAKEKKNKKSKKDNVVIENILKNDVDSMSYALGMNVGADFGKSLTGIPGGKSNIDLIIKGFATAMKLDSTLMTAEFAKEYFTKYISQAQIKDADSKKSEGEKFLTENMKQPDVKVTSSGLQYKVIKEAVGAKPNEQDTVVVHYVGTLINGTKFDSSLDRGEPIEFPLNQVIKGWTEGVQLMSVGSKYRLFVPFNLAYGEQGAGGVIPPFATLIFDVELINIKPFQTLKTIPTEIQQSKKK